MLPETEKLVTEYLALVNEDPDHNLEARKRLALYLSFGPSRITKDYIGDDKEFLKEEFLNFTIADYALGWLAILTTKKVLPIWEKAASQIDEKEWIVPQTVLAMAEQALKHEINFDEADEELYEFAFGRGIEKEVTYDLTC